jgi:hypothetical protein
VSGNRPLPNRVTEPVMGADKRKSHTAKLRCGFSLEKVRPSGFEPLASSSGGMRSIQLSYGRERFTLVNRSTGSE